MSTIPSTGEALLVTLERFYAPLIEKLNLTPEQSRRFYEVILDDRMKRQAQMTDLLRHSDLSKMAEAMTDIQKKTDASLRALLEAADFKQYQEYQSGVGDRALLDQMKSDFKDSPLTEEQHQQLLSAMESGRKAIGNVASDGVVVFSIADTSDVMNEKLNRQEAIDRRVLQLAGGFLSPLQLQILGAAQARMMAGRKNGYSKARETFGKPA